MSAPYQFRSLVLEGGGVKGIAYAGALEALEKRGITDDITRVAGTSAGAISAAFIALGGSSDYVARAIGGTNFRSFMDSSFGVIRDANRLLHEYGWFMGKEFVDWMSERVGELTGNPQFTFGDLWDAVENDHNPKFKKLYVTGSNLNRQDVITYSGQNRTVTIADAVRVSMSIPLFFVAQRDKDDNVLVDGGVTWNYPIDIFDQDRFLSDPAHGTKPHYPTTYGADHVYNKETLGLRVDTSDQIKAEKANWAAPRAEIKDFIDYARVLVTYMGELANRMHLHENDWHRTIFIDASGVGTTEFNLADAKIKTLLQNGRDGVEKYFEWFDNPQADPTPQNRI